MDRRTLLKLGGAAALTAVAGSLVTRLPFKKPEAAAAGQAGDEHMDDLVRHQWAMVIDLRRCDGCSACAKACRKAHYLPEGQDWLKVYKLKSVSGREYHLPRPCMQCENPPCQKVCPVGATFTSPDGIVLIDQNKCIGCRLCMAACPYEARYFNWTDPPPVPSTLGKPRPEWPVPQQRGTVGKCVLCVHNLRYGKLPMCVESCGMQALYVGDLASGLATTGIVTVQLGALLADNDAFRLKEELNTRPRVFYIPGHGQDIRF